MNFYTIWLIHVVLCVTPLKFFPILVFVCGELALFAMIFSLRFYEEKNEMGSYAHNLFDEMSYSSWITL